MSLQLTLSIEDHTLNPLSFGFNFFRETDDLTGQSNSPMKGGIITFTLFLHDETSDKSPFADAFADQSKKVNMTINTRLALNSAEQIMSYSVHDGQCVQYAINFTNSQDPNTQENGFVTVSVVAPQITVGNATFTLGE